LAVKVVMVRELTVFDPVVNVVVVAITAQAGNEPASSSTIAQSAHRLVQRIVRRTLSKAVTNSKGFRGKMKDELRNIVFSFSFW
jgi:hypothetical protein